jgi:cysteine desulfurase / selenocysteine lyase
LFFANCFRFLKFFVRLLARRLPVPLKPLLSPDAFTGIEEVTHLCTGGEAPWLKVHDTVYADFARLKSGGYDGRAEIYRRGEDCRRKMGQLWRVPADHIAFMPSAAEGMSWLARGLDWCQGDNVVVPNLEFPSVAYAWKQLEERGVEIRLVPHRDWRVDEDDLLAAADSRTRVLAVSQVSFYTGQNLDIERLGVGCRQRGILLAVDATHAAGAVRVPAAAADWCVSSAYKWLLATHGVAPCYASDNALAQIKDTCYGWNNLAVWPAQAAVRQPQVETKPMPQRLEPGNPAMAVVLFLDRALDVLLDLGVEAIQDHDRDLSEYISQGLEAMGLQVISPSARQGRSGNTCFLADDAKGMEEALAQEQVLVWGDYGRVRVSGHLYNGEDDVMRLLKALAAVR